MDGVSILLGAAASFLAVLLGIFTLGGKVTRWLEKLFTGVLVKTGLIRYRRTNDLTATDWPNGSDNLPDTLDNMYREQNAIRADLEEIKENGR